MPAAATRWTTAIAAAAAIAVAAGGQEPPAIPTSGAEASAILATDEPPGRWDPPLPGLERWFAVESETDGPLPMTRSVFSLRGTPDFLPADHYRSDDVSSFFFENTGVSYRSGLFALGIRKQTVLDRGATNSWTTGWSGELMQEGGWALYGEEIVASQRLFGDGGRGVDGGLLKGWIDRSRVSLFGIAGVRHSSLTDDFSFFGEGSVLGRVDALTWTDHELTGPEMGVGAVIESGRWRIEASLSGVAGYNRVEFHQRSSYGDEPTPDALNRSAAARSVVAEDQTGTEEFGWLGETRLTTSFRLTQNLRFDASWVWTITDPTYSAASATVLTLPYFSVEVPESETVDFDAWFLGLTYTR